MRSGPDGPVEAVLVLGTEGAPPRQRRGRPVDSAAPEPVPTSRATITRPQPFASRESAAAWLSELRADEGLVEADLAAAIAVLNRALFARRLATADPYLAEVSLERALVVRGGSGAGDSVADGRFAEALELPRPGARRVKRSMEAPDERFAALLGAREEPLVAEELVLRARADLDAGRTREAALQARVALEALASDPGLAPLRAGVGAAANAALAGPLDGTALRAVTEAVEAMEGALRRHRLGGG